MLQISVVIKLSGLLLLTPSNSGYQLPYYALLPEADGHEASLAYSRPPNGCSRGAERDGDLCFFRIEGEDITIGPDVPRAERRFNGSLGNVSKAASVPVDTSLMGNSPPTNRLRARIRLNAGKQTGQCYLARWFFNGNAWAPLGNVITWEFSPDPGDLVLTRRKLSDLGGPVDTLVVPRSPSGNFELFVLHAPREDKNDTTSHFLMEAQHFNYYYNMIGVDSAAWRPLPVLLRRVLSRCEWPRSSRSPGAPTCLVAGGVPASGP